MQTLKEVTDALGVGILTFAAKINTLFKYWQGELQRLAVGASKPKTKKRGMSTL